MKRYVPLLALVLLTACGPKQYHIATVSATGAHESLKFAEDTLDSTICGKPTAPVPPLKCTTVEQRRELAPLLVKAYQDDGTAQKVIHDWEPSTGARPDYAALLVQITKAIQTIVDALPTDAAKAKVTAAVNAGGK